MSRKAMRLNLTMKNALQNIDDSKKKQSLKASGSKDDIAKKEIAGALSAKCGHEMTDMLNFLDALEVIANEEVMRNGQFAIPGIAMIKKSNKPERSEGKKVLLTKKDNVKANAGHYATKALAKQSLKDNIK